MDDLAWEFGCRLCSLPTTYLGMPLGAPYKSVTVWDGVEERFRRRLAMWKRIFIQGREGDPYSKHVIESTHPSNVFVVLTKLSQTEIRENPKGLPLGCNLE